MFRYRRTYTIKNRALHGGCPVFRYAGQIAMDGGMLLFFAHLPKKDFPGCRPPAGHCRWRIPERNVKRREIPFGVLLLIRVCPQTIKFHPTPRKIPRRRPPGIPYLQYRMHFWGPAPGKVSPGEAWRDRPLLKRRVSPRSSPTAGTLSGGALQGLLLRSHSPSWFFSTRRAARRRRSRSHSGSTRRKSDSSDSSRPRNFSMLWNSHRKRLSGRRATM